MWIIPLAPLYIKAGAKMTYIGASEIIHKKQQYFFQNGMHFYKNPPQFVRGEMQYLYDTEGKRYTDFFGGVTVVNCGHANPEVSAAVAEQAKTLQHTSIIYLTEPMVLLAEKLASVLPGDINRSFFCCSGTEANEGALLLARLATQKRGFISFSGGLHGRSALTMSVTGIPMWRIDPYLDEHVYFADCYYQVGEEPQVTSERVLKQVEAILVAHGHDIAACIVEPIQGNGGMMVPHKDFFKALKPMLEAHGVLLIADEVQTGFARTGEMFAMTHFGVVPDIMTMAKALGNGAPIGVFSATEAVAAHMTKPSASTLGGNPVSMRAGLAVLDYIEKNELALRAKTLGAQLEEGLKLLQTQYPFIKDIRGLGLMLGAEIADMDNGKTAAEVVDHILEAMKDRGFIVGKNGMGRNVLAFQPPLVVESTDIEAMLNHLNEVLKNL